MSDYIPSDLLRFALMHELQERVVEHGICPKCHKKSLQSKYIGGEMEWFQCSICLNVYALPERRLVG
jgi:ribosomal protein L40E